MVDTNIIIEKKVKAFALKNKLKTRKSKNGVFLSKKAKYKPTDFSNYVSFQENPSDLKYVFKGIKDDLGHFEYLDKNYEQNQEETFKKNLKSSRKRNR
jgi:hypothetical protein